MTCAHHNFDCQARIARLEDSGQFMAELRIHCTDCGKPFQFLGLQPGIDLQGARVSLDGLEASIAIAPEGTHPNPFQRMSFDITRFNG
jgi:hypothetical protein